MLATDDYAARLLGFAYLCSWVYLTFVVALAAWVGVTVTLCDWRPIVVTSESMAPDVNTGDVLLVAEPIERIERGEVIVFRDPQERGRLNAHRVVAGDASNGYRTRGDANASADATVVSPDAVVGVGRLVVPAIGLPLVWAEEQRLAPVLMVGAVTAVALVLACRPRRRTEGPQA